MAPVGQLDEERLIHVGDGGDGLRRKALLLVLAILASTLAAAAAALLLVPPLVPSATLAYTFGLRHGFDVDHIAAIDNATRRLTTGRKRPATVGLFFAMGHSLVVTIMCAIVAVTSDVMKRHLTSFEQIGGILGASISGSFLLLIGAANVWSARHLWRSWRDGDEESGHSHALVGVFTRCCPGLFEGIRSPVQMLPVGFLFGLGFDTSSEVGLLGIVAVSHDDVPRASIMLLPLLFMGGMCLVDTLNGALMAWAYASSLDGGARQRMYYNLFLTGTSGLVALVVGIVELLGAVASGVGLEGGFWQALREVNDHFEILGLTVVGIFVASMILVFGFFRRSFLGGSGLAADQAAVQASGSLIGAACADSYPSSGTPR